MSQIKQFAAELAANEYGVHISWLFKKTRNPDIVQARQLASYLIHKIAGYSQTETGQFFNQDHVSIIHSCKRVSEQYELRTTKGNYANQLFRDRVDSCIAKMPKRNDNSIMVVLNPEMKISQNRIDEIVRIIAESVPEAKLIKATTNATY